MTRQRFTAQHIQHFASSTSRPFAASIVVHRGVTAVAGEVSDVDRDGQRFTSTFTFARLTGVRAWVLQELQGALRAGNISRDRHITLCSEVYARLNSDMGGSETFTIIGGEPQSSSADDRYDSSGMNVTHAWLCHGADEHGYGGSPCEDGCDRSPDPVRLERYRNTPRPPGAAPDLTADELTAREDRFGVVGGLFNTMNLHLDDCVTDLHCTPRRFTFDFKSGDSFVVALFVEVRHDGLVGRVGQTMHMQPKTLAEVAGFRDAYVRCTRFISDNAITDQD